MTATLIDSALILERLDVAGKPEALAQMVSALTQAGRVPAGRADEIGQLLTEREALGTTGIGNGVAVPHVKTDVVDQVVLVLARIPDGVDYDAIDGRAVHTVFLLLSPLDGADTHLQSLRWVSSLARSGDFRSFVQAAADEAAIRELLREMSDLG